MCFTDVHFTDGASHSSVATIVPLFYTMTSTAAFPPNGSSLGGKFASDGSIQWKRLSDICRTTIQVPTPADAHEQHFSSFPSTSC